MRVTVIIPTYNYGRFLREAIASVQQQTVQDLEIVVVDDGSTDDTPEVLARIDDPRLRSVRTANGGIAAARNHGLALARGDFIAFLDADDRWHAEKLERQLAMFEGEPTLGLVFSNFVRFDHQQVFARSQFDFIPELASVPVRPSRQGGGWILLGDTFASLVPLGQFATWVQTVLVRRSVLGDLQFPPRNIFNEDMHFMLRLYLRAPAGYIREPLVEVRRHGGNSYEEPIERMEHDPIALAAMLAENLTPEQRRILLRRIGRSYRALGYHHFWRGSAKGAAQSYLAALRYPGGRTASLRYLAALPFRPVLRAARRDGQ